MIITWQMVLFVYILELAFKNKFRNNLVFVGNTRPLSMKVSLM